MNKIEIRTNTRGHIQTAEIKLDSKQLSLSLFMENGIRKTYTAHDFYVCFGLLRADIPNTKFLCKGAKLNVYPSRMSSQMSLGLMAYELELGRPAECYDVVRIFDYEESDITNDIQQQRNFYKRWVDSLTG